MSSKRHRRAIGTLAASAVTCTAAFALSGPATARQPLSAGSSAASATATATASPTPTKAAPKLQPAIGTVVQPPSVVWGSTATVTYTVTVSGTAWAGKPVQIATAPVGKPFTYTDAVTDDAGKVVLTQTATGRLQVKLVVVATDTTLQAVTLPANISVVSKAVVTSPGRGTFRAVLYGASGQQVQVQRLSGKQWMNVKVYTAKLALYTLSGLARGDQYRIVVPGTTAIVGLISPAVTIT